VTDFEQCSRRVGQTLCGKWTLEKLVGVGGMAAVYVAAHKIGRRDAIKILHKDIASVPEVRRRFEQEAQAVNTFKHPGAVEIRDIDVSEDGEPFLVMELLSGKPLSRVFREDKFEIADVLRWTDELLDVLAAAHAQNIVHRDIKPDNLFVTDEGRLKVLDFGIARIRSGAGTAMKTRTGATIGTVSYMSPEQAKGGDIDGRADLFSVGATMFRLIAKRKIHEAENDVELLKKMATEPAPALASVAAGAPEAVCRIVDRALRFDREQRYANAAAMQADVREAAAPAGRVVSPAAESVMTPASQPVPPPPSDTPTVGPPNRPPPILTPTVDDPPAFVPTSHPPHAPTRVDATKLAAGIAPPPPSHAPAPSRLNPTALLIAAVAGMIVLGLVAVLIVAAFVGVRRTDIALDDDAETPAPEASAAQAEPSSSSPSPPVLPPPPKPGATTTASPKPAPAPAPPPPQPPQPPHGRGHGGR
jgi:serine/threonine-protein kinase